MLTGDRVDTALAVGGACGLVEPSGRVVMVVGNMQNGEVERRLKDARGSDRYVLVGE
jgi:hypothetical protein